MAGVSGVLREPVQCLSSEVLLRCARAEAGTDVHKPELAVSSCAQWDTEERAPVP